MKSVDLKTFPKHFHIGSEEQVIESSISDAPEEALHQFLGFIGDKFREFRHGWGKTTQLPTLDHRLLTS